MIPFWNLRFADLPLIRIPSAMFPSHDGDMAELAELADRVLAGSGRVAWPAEDFLWRQTIDATWINPTQLLAYWPEDIDIIKEWSDA